MITLPKKLKAKHQVLKQVTLELMLKQLTSDFPLMRRTLVDYGYLGRDNAGVKYQVNPIYTTRFAARDDLDEILELIKDVVKQLNEKDIPIWDDNYPSQFILEEIQQNRLVIMSEFDEIISYFSFNPFNRGADKVS